MRLASSSLLRSVLKHELLIDGEYTVTPEGVTIPAQFSKPVEKLKKGDSTFLLSKALIQVKKRVVVAKWHPKLRSHGVLTTGEILSPTAEFEALAGHFEALRAIDPNKLEYLAKLYVLD